MFSVSSNETNIDNLNASDLFTFLNHLKDNHVTVKLLNDLLIKLESQKVSDIFSLSNEKHLKDIINYMIIINILIKIIQHT